MLLLKIESYNLNPFCTKHVWTSPRYCCLHGMVVVWYGYRWHQFPSTEARWHHLHTLCSIRYIGQSYEIRCIPISTKIILIWERSSHALKDIDTQICLTQLTLPVYTYISLLLNSPMLSVYAPTRLFTAVSLQKYFNLKLIIIVSNVCTHMVCKTRPVPV